MQTVKWVGRFLCRVGLHRYRTNEIGYTYRCTRVGCCAMYHDGYVGKMITRALNDVDKESSKMKNPPR